MYHREWTDQTGVIHLWQLGVGETLRGKEIGLHTAAPNLAACRTCVQILALGTCDPITGPRGE